MFILILFIIWIIYNSRFILFGVQFLQGDHQLNKKLGNLLFIKLENFTKSELLKKIQNLEESNKTIEAKEQSLLKRGYNGLINYLSELLKLFNLIKEVMYKLTFISFFIKLMFKYKIFRQIISILRKILFLGIGSSFLNFFGFFDFFHEIWVEINMIFDYLIKWIKMYFEWLKNILVNTKEEIKTPEPNVDFLRNQNIIETNKSIDEEVSKNWTITQIIIITSFIVISCFIYVYFDEIKSFIKPGNPASDSTDILNNDEKIELIDIINKKGKENFVSPPTEETYFNDPLKKISEMTDNNASSSKVKLEELPTIEVTDTSGETVYYEVKNSDNLSSPTDSVSSTETIKPLNWRSGIDQSTKESIEYVEKHFPKSELDNVDYIKNLINEVKQTNMNFANQTKNIIDSVSVKELSDKVEIAKNIDNWVNDMFDKLKPFE